MAINNYTSNVEAGKSASQIVEALNRSGHTIRTSIVPDGEGGVRSVETQLDVGGRAMWFRIEPDPAGMLEAMREDSGVKAGYCTLEQATRTAWKNELEYVQVLLAKVAANQARLAQLLLGHGVNMEGETVFQHFIESGGVRKLHAGGDGA